MRRTRRNTRRFREESGIENRSINISIEVFNDNSENEIINSKSIN